MYKGLYIPKKKVQNMNIIHYGMLIIVSIAICLLLFVLMRFIIGKVRTSPIRFLNPTQYLPEEEVQSLKQFYYLLMIMLLFILIVNFFFDNNIILSNSPEFYLLHAVLDVLVSIYVASIIYDKSNKNMLLIFFMIPFPSIAYMLFGFSFIEYWDFIRIPAMLYLISYFYGKFKSYTTKNRLNLSIFLLFAILFISIVITMFIENEDPLNAIVMVSNAFTSNGYAILGDTTGGKVNSIFLVWSGYILSGVATATLTVAIMMRGFKSKLDDYDEKLDQLQKSIDELKK